MRGPGNNITNTINPELGSKASQRSILRFAILAFITFAGKSLTEAHISLMPFLIRGGGYLSHASPVQEHKQRKRKNIPQNPILHHLDHVQHSMNKIGHRIRIETVKHWNGIQSHLDKEWTKLASNVVKLFRVNKRKVNLRRLDDVVASFKYVLRNGDKVDVSNLLKACRAHLTLVKSGGAALKVVAKDMEGNLDKAEVLHNKLRSQNKGKDLSQLLEIERQQGIHEGNMLRDPSAAMGLLWIRRSLAFQLDLYSSLLPSSTKSPTVAALEAYDKHLSPFHGWMLQKIFPLSLSQLPDREVFIAKFGGMDKIDLNERYEREIVEKLRDLVKVWEPLIGVWKEEFERMDMEDVRRA